MAPGTYDGWLHELCGKKRLKQDDPWLPLLNSRSVYTTIDDFPILGERLLKLQSFNMRQDPSTLRGFAVDRRNPFNFYTFWAVIIVGVISIMLSAVQCFIAASQLALAAKEMSP